MWGQPPSAVRSSEARRPLRGGQQTETRETVLTSRPLIENAEMTISVIASAFIGGYISILRVASDRVEQF